MENTIGITFDTFLVEGLRTEYFDYVGKNAAIANKRYGILMRPDPPDSTSHYLQPDTGSMLTLIFDVSSSATPGAVLVIDTMTVNDLAPNFSTIYGDFHPVFIPGKIVILSCGHGDVDCSGEINIGDMVYLVDFMFNSGPAPDPYGGDVDGDGDIDVADLVYLVDYFFNSGPPPPNK